MARLDKEREVRLSPIRYDYALKVFKENNIEVEQDIPNKCIIIKYKGNNIRFYPYSGWATGKGIKDCRGLKKLLKQIL